MCAEPRPLTREGIVSPEFSSIEEYLGKNTRSYYDVLARVGQGSWHPENDTREWIRYVLTAHLRQAGTILRRSKEIERLWVELDSLIAKHKLPERTIDAMFDAVIGMRVRRSVYKAIINRQAEEPISDQTATRDLQALTTAGLLIPMGERRGRYYLPGEPLIEIRAASLDRRVPRDETDPFSIPAGPTPDRNQGELF